MAASKKVAKKKTTLRKAAKRELIDSGTNKLYVRRNKQGTSYKEVKEVGRSLAQDQRRSPRSPGPRLATLLSSPPISKPKAKAAAR